MKKLFLPFLFSLLVCTSHAQLNPIKGLKFKHWYEFPFNCFTLEWSSPDSSATDTLIDYNIYRNNTLYLFTKYTGIGSNRCIGDTSTKYTDFMNFNPHAFYVHVTAVYNSKKEQSIYNDSAFFRGAMTGLTENEANKSLFNIYPQPFSFFTTLQANTPLNNADLRFYNVMGMLVKEIKNVSGQTITIERDDLASGIYFIQLIQNNKVIGKDKLIISDI